MPRSALRSARLARAIPVVFVRDVPAAVFPDNRLQVGLLGMSFLSKLSHFEVAGGRLVLRR